MVMSGLEDSNRLYVSHYRLAIHFILALGLICYALWFALELLIPKENLIQDGRLKKFTGWILSFLVLQLAYGAFMAGLKAATYAPTWPDINGHFFPYGGNPSSGILSFFDNPIRVHFIHRNLAYVILILLVAWYVQSVRDKGSLLFNKTKWLPMALVLLQIILGILTVINSPNPNALVWLGVTHQLVGMILLLSLLFAFYLLSGRKV